MVPEQIDRLALRWSREDLARYGGVSLASIFLMERFGSATEVDDAKIRGALARGLAEKSAARNTDLGPLASADDGSRPSPQQDGAPRNDGDG